MTSTDDLIKHRIDSIFPSKEVAARAVDLLTSTKPNGFGRRSNAPYFSKIYGDELKRYIDIMRQNKEDIVYRYSTWCTSESGVSRQTLYNRVNQSIRWILERDDKDHVYSEWYDTVLVNRVQDVGVVVKYKPGFGNNAHTSMTPEMVTPAAHKPYWMRKMDEWIESDDVEPFVKENLALSPAEQTEIKIQLAQLSNVEYSVSGDAVRLIKTSA